jgi:hypothetical protein
MSCIIYIPSEPPAYRLIDFEGNASIENVASLTGSLCNVTARSLVDFIELSAAIFDGQLPWMRPSRGSHLGLAAILDKQHHSWAAIVDRQPSWISLAVDGYKWRGDRPPS